MSWYTDQKQRHEASKEKHDPATCERKHCNHGMTIAEIQAWQRETGSGAYGRAHARMVSRQDTQDAAKGEKATRKAQRKAARRGES